MDKVKKDDILSPLFALLDGGLPLSICFKKIFKCKKHLLLGQITQQYSKSLISFVEDNLLLKNIGLLIVITIYNLKILIYIYNLQIYIYIYKNLYI